MKNIRYKYTIWRLKDYIFIVFILVYGRVQRFFKCSTKLKLNKNFDVRTRCR